MRRAFALITAAALAFVNGCEPVNTHQSLMSAMLSCQEEVCAIVESIHSVDDANAAEPRVAAQAKKFREYSNRFLLLGLPDAERAKQLKDEFGEREQKLAERIRQAGANLSQGNKGTVLAVIVALNDFSAAQRDFSTKAFGLQMTRATGKAETTTAPTDIHRHEQALTSIAAHIATITSLVAAMHDANSARQQSAPIEAEIAAIKDDVEKYRSLPPIRDVPSQIQLDPAKQRFREANKQYNQTREEASQRPGVRGPLVILDVHLSQTLHYLDGTLPPPNMRRGTPPVGPAGESPGARKAREMMEAARARRSSAPPSPPPQNP